MNYFNDYKEIEQRNRKGAPALKQSKLNDSNDKDQPEEEQSQMKGLMEQEKERRLKELPVLRPPDQIDISEKQLVLIKNIFDSLPRISSTREAVQT